MEAFDRVVSLIGKDNYEILKNSSIALFGVGGVGGFVAEALIRSGVGKLTVFDNDIVEKSNLNRQLIATRETLGSDKTEALKNRLLSVNPDAEIITHKVFYLPNNAEEYPLDGYSYVIDCVDTVSAKIEIIARAKKVGTPVISCMGTGGKIEPTKLKVAPIEKTSGCPLARVMRRELKKLGISGVKTVYSEEVIIQPLVAEKIKNGERNAPPSMIFVPAVAGLILAKEVVFDIIKKATGEKL